jgi:5-methylcytosine-specific restriction endonuclease McrA
MPKSDNYISEVLRKHVAKRANFRCEYCLISEEDAYFSFEIDHIISKKHFGLTEDVNLAYSCLNCNRNKGSDIASVALESKKLTRFYNPRIDIWEENFALDNVFILPILEIGEVTTNIFKLNNEDLISERLALKELNRYP